MRYQETNIPGVMVVDPELWRDDRGFFTRIFCRDDFAVRGLDFQPAQANLSGNLKRGTLRGLHYQAAPHGEDKLVRAVRGAVFDVALDLRKTSPAFGAWAGFELSAENRRSLLVPKGCAHGYLTLTDDSEIMYLTSSAYHPAAERGLRWDDPFGNVGWPFPPLVVSAKDQNWPDWNPDEAAP